MKVTAGDFASQDSLIRILPNIVLENPFIVMAAIFSNITLSTHRFECMSAK